MIAFDDGKASEFNTLLLTDWIAHTPPEVLALNFGVPADSFRNIPTDNLWIFQGDMPGPLAEAPARRRLVQGLAALSLRVLARRPAAAGEDARRRGADRRQQQLQRPRRRWPRRW
ncbi:hypothetical protein BCC0238_006264 [Burkholderia gladioli]|nr:hypothetical protein [Burkholderia gladioli]